jgi:hypothetical protein
MHSLCEFYPGICPTTEGKARKTSVKVEVKDGKTEDSDLDSCPGALHVQNFYAFVFY